MYLKLDFNGAKDIFPFQWDSVRRHVKSYVICTSFSVPPGITLVSIGPHKDKFFKMTKFS